MAEMIKGLKKLERKLRQLQKRGGGPISRAALNGMAQPMKTAIRRGVAGSSVSPRLKRAARETISSSVKKDKETREYGLKVGFGIGRQSKVRRTKAEARAGRGGGRGVGISAVNIHWPVFGTGEGSVLAGKIFQTEGSKQERKSRATGKARRHKSGKSTGSTGAVLVGLIPVAIASSSPLAIRTGAAKAKVALRMEAKKRR